MRIQAAHLCEMEDYIGDCEITVSCMEYGGLALTAEVRTEAGETVEAQRCYSHHELHLCYEKKMTSYEFCLDFADWAKEYFMNYFKLK